MKRVLVTIPDDEWDAIEKNVMPDSLGEADAVRMIITDWLASKGFIFQRNDEIATHEIMIATVVQMMHEKGIIDFNIWESKVKEQMK